MNTFSPASLSDTTENTTNTAIEKDAAHIETPLKAIEAVTQTTFEDLGVPAILTAVLTKVKYTHATPIQQQAIPFGLKGRDILGSAQTGTGKTAAFTIPMIAHLLANKDSKALVLAPTRELATQIMQAITQMTDHSWKMRCVLLIGGDSMTRQLHTLQQQPRIIIGTPGRINDHLARRSLNLSKADFLVLDETDRMLDMGFGVQIDKVLSFMPAQRQTLLFSATLPGHITKLAERYMKNPERVAVGSTTAPIAKIKQETLEVSQPQKYEALTAELDRRSGSVIVFVRTKHGADRLTNKLSRENHSATAIHGDLRQNQRDKAIRKFREGSIRILVATDVAARGLDVPHIEHVINYDLPQCPEDYIHRIGRTGRNGAEGQAMAFISPEEREKWNAIQHLLNPSERGTHKPGQAPVRGRNAGKNPGKARSRHQRRDWKGPNRHRDENGQNSRDQEPRTPRNAARFKERGNERNTERNNKRSEYRGDLVRVRERDENVWDNQSSPDRSSQRPSQRPPSRDNRPASRPEFKERQDRPYQDQGRRDNRGRDRAPEERNGNRFAERNSGRNEGFKKDFRDNRADNRTDNRNDRPRNDRPRQDRPDGQNASRPYKDQLGKAKPYKGDNFRSESAKGGNFKSGNFKPGGFKGPKRQTAA